MVAFGVAAEWCGFSDALLPMVVTSVQGTFNALVTISFADMHNLYTSKLATASDSGGGSGGGGDSAGDSAEATEGDGKEEQLEQEKPSLADICNDFVSRDRLQMNS